MTADHTCAGSIDCLEPGGFHVLCEKHRVEINGVSRAGEIPAQKTGQSRDLIIPVKGIYFDQIREGTKLHEYRLITDYWRRRIVDRHYDHIILLRGYPKGGGVEGQTRLTRKWRGYHAETLTHEHFGPLPVTVYAIDVSQPAETRP